MLTYPAEPECRKGSGSGFWQAEKAAPGRRSDCGEMAGAGRNPMRPRAAAAARLAADRARNAPRWIEPRGLGRERGSAAMRAQLALGTARLRPKGSTTASRPPPPSQGGYRSGLNGLSKPRRAGKAISTTTPPGPAVQSTPKGLSSVPATQACRALSGARLQAGFEGRMLATIRRPDL